MGDQLDLLDWQPPPASVVTRCAAMFGGNCITIYHADTTTPLRVETCRGWCPLLKEAIDG